MAVLFVFCFFLIKIALICRPLPLSDIDEIELEEREYSVTVFSDTHPHSDSSVPM